MNADELREQLREEKVRNAELMKERADEAAKWRDGVSQSFKAITAKLVTIELSLATTTDHETRIADHEKRIRTLEDYKIKATTAVVLLVALLKWLDHVLWK